MATLVLSTIGNALGGPVGGAIGALIGQSIDQQLLGPSTRGPRLGDLKVQSSSYGTQIPRIYGTMRVAGSVIWATDLVESSEMSGAKGQPDTTYSYSVSFAVALSSRVVQSVGRIWADGKLLRGADGDFKVSTKFRLCPGGEDQEIDPLIASVEGLTSTPAYRGLALAVFEDLELGDYGNRIPFLTFEVVAEKDPSLGQVLNDASGGAINSGDARAIAGFAAYGQCVKAAVQPLVDTFAIELADDGARLVSPAALVTDIVNDELGNSSNGQVAARYQREQLPARSLPAILRLGYYDAALDYQSGEARAMSAEKRGIEEQIDLPAVLSAGDAKSLAQTVIAREWAQRDKLTLRLPPKYIGLQPGSLVALDLSPVVWRVEQCTIDSFVAVVELRPSWRSEAWLAGDSGRIIANVDEPVGAINLALFDVPDVLQLGSDTPTLLLASSAVSGAWKARSVEIVAGEQSFATTTARRRSVLGRALTSLDDGSADLIDEENAFDVELIDPEQWLVSCDDDGLVAGSNLALLGSEVLQFGRAEPLGEGRFRLSRLVRGRVGTEWAVGTHAAGEFFVLIQPDSFRAVRLPYWTIGSSVTANVTGVAGTSSSGPVTVTGESLRPPSPVSVDAAVDPDGSLSLAWTRRSRKGFAWIDEIDAPLGESSELYRVTITGNANSIERVTNEPALLVAASELAVAGAGPITIEVRQIGDAAASRPAARTLTFPTGASQ